ncbi:MAG: hypothetical protein N2690_02515 [Rhodocyclaceae bacterium]|nr:hypothetical protein [Rhodocyclaceae bacterium]
MNLKVQIIGVTMSRSHQLLRRQIFILRRATWFGRCKIADLTEAFGITPQAASRDLTRAPTLWRLDGRDLLVHERGAVRRILGLQEHPQAAPFVMLELLRRGAPFQESGLREHECLTLRQPLNGLQPDIQAHLAAILRALIRLEIRPNQVIQRTLDIQYVGMKAGETVRTRWIAPVGLEFDGAQARLWAHDLQAPGYPLKSFVLSRIAGASLSARQMPGDLSPELELPKEKVCLQATFDARLTKDQRDAIARELSLDPNGRTMTARHRVFHLQRFYAQSNTATETIWPPLVSLTEVEQS